MLFSSDMPLAFFRLTLSDTAFRAQSVAVARLYAGICKKNGFAVG